MTKSDGSSNRIMYSSQRGNGLNGLHIRAIKGIFDYCLLFSIVCIFTVPNTVTAALVSVSPLASEEKADFIRFSDKQIKIDARGLSLEKVLQSLQNLSRVNFTVSESLLGQKTEYADRSS